MTTIVPSLDDSERYDLVLVGTGFASSFFLLRYLKHAPAGARVLVLERGRDESHAWQLQHRRSSSIPADEVFTNLTPAKEWLTSPGFGGNSRCWWGGAVRMLPADFELKSRYGVGRDWPLRYADLEPYYDAVEAVMSVSGPLDSPMPRSRPFPQPPHLFSDPDARLKRHFPRGWFEQATVRARVPTATRTSCCASGACDLCPEDAKFTIQNGLAWIYRDPRVTLRLESPVEMVETAAGLAQAVIYRQGGRQRHARGALVALGASALFNPYLLLRSGDTHPLLGRRLSEQRGVDVTLNLQGMKSYNGSTMISGNGYLFYDGPHRRERAACLIETWNVPFHYLNSGLRGGSGRWTERMQLRFMFEDLPRNDNTVTVDTANPQRAATRFNGYSDYAHRGAAQLPQMLETLGQALPIERVEKIAPATTAAHIQGTVVMGDDPADSIVDRHLVHHRLRNLLVLGAGAFPSTSPTYPTLTLSALSMMSADHLFGARA